jgi:hypothetical protein
MVFDALPVPGRASSYKQRKVRANRYTSRVVLYSRDKGIGMDVMEIVKFVVNSALTIGVMALIIALIAGLFMIIFSIGTGIDRKITE